MPNTLCHFGVQIPLFARARQPSTPLWALIGCIIPDLPWMAVKLLVPLHLVDPYALRLYCTGQASLVSCLLLAAALACLSSAPHRVFAILAGNCLLHLLLDTVEVKWGNGVHLLLPFSTKMLQFNLLWPEHPLIQGLTGLGLVVLLLLARKKLPPPITAWPSKRWSAVATLFLFAHLLLPLTLIGPLQGADAYYLRTLGKVEERTGKAMAFDRVHYFADNSTLRTFAGEHIIVSGSVPRLSGRVSFAGRFLGPASFFAEEHHYHRDQRDLATLIGLFMACALLGQSVILSRFRSTKNSQGPP